MTGDPRVVRLLLACYPSGWRRRYGPEYGQLLCDLRVQRHPLLILDSLHGALRAQLAPGGLLMSARSPMTTAVWAVGLFTVAGIAFQKLSEDLTGAGGSTADALRAWLVAAAAVSMLALLVATAPTGVALLRGRDRRAWGYVAVPVVGAAAWFGVVRALRAVGQPGGVHSGANLAVVAVVVLAGVGVVAATAWAASAVLRRVPAEQPARLRPVALVVLAVGMGATAVLALAWGLSVRAGDPGVVSGDQGLVATPFVPSWVATVVLLAAAAALAAVAGRRQIGLAH